MSEYGMLNALMTPGLTHIERNVYAYLVGRANGARVCWPLIADIAAHLGMSDRSVMAATKRLVELERLEVVRRYKDTNNYRIVEVPGLYDRPVYGPASPPPVVNGTATSHADLKKTAPETPPPSDLKKTAPETPDADLKKTAPETVSPEKIDILGCKIPDSDLKKTAAHPLEQVRAIKEEKEQTHTLPATPPASASAGARACVRWGNPFRWDEFQAAYPPNDGSPSRARVAYAQALADGADPQVLIDAVKVYPFRQPQRFVVHPVTWLQERRWEANVDTRSLEERCWAKMEAMLDAQGVA